MITQGSFGGAMTALVTPFRDGQVDDAALIELVERQIAGGIDGLVPCGTTGEASTLEAAEHAQVIRLVVDAAKGRVPVIAGCGSNSTAHAIALAKAAAEAGADGLLVVTPYYNKPSQEGLLQHFLAVCAAVPLPLVVYNIPGRSVVDLATETLARLADRAPRIVAVKEATGQVARAQAIVRQLGDRLIVLSGDDAINTAIYAVGGRGCISVASNLMPREVAAAWDAAAAGDFATARAQHERTLELTELLFSEPSPAPTKAAFALLGRMGDEVRLPLLAMSAAGRERLRGALLRAGLA